MEYKAKVVIKMLKDNGFKESRIKGDHHRFEDNKGHKVTVAYASLKDSIPNGTYNSILKQAGLK